MKKQDKQQQQDVNTEDRAPESRRDDAEAAELRELSGRIRTRLVAGDFESNA